MESVARQLIGAGRELGDALRGLKFSEPVTHTYLSTDYAGAGYEGYLSKFGNTRKAVLFLGMNPGPFGMAQTGVPFGEIAAVRDWMGLNFPVGKPDHEHPKRRIEGLDCRKSEVSGRRLWGYFQEKYPQAGDFFKNNLVINYCPLIWMKASGANITPDKIRTEEMAAVESACQAHLVRVLEVLRPGHLIGVGAFAEKKLLIARNTSGLDAEVGRILHPSPASPAANRGWAEAADAQLRTVLATG